MLFSLEWILALAPAKVGAQRAAELLTARGLTVDAVDETAYGVVLDIDIPANRPDCLGHLGVARELAAANGVELAPPPSLPSPTAGATGWVDVAIEDPALCRRYTACLVRGVKVAPSPDWVVRRLEACGLRSVSNVVDASNLVLLELGQPIHFFDHRLLRAPDPGGPPRILVRAARAGERLRTLDGEDRALDPRALLITDGTAAVALAGVIGGADSEISDETRDVLIEAAHFDPQSIRGTARRLGVQTDASYRFERDIDAEGIPRAQALAIALLGQLAGGEPADVMVDIYPRPVEQRTLTLRPARLYRLLGFEPARDEIDDALTALHLDPSAADAEAIRVRVPSFRPDLSREADLVEEVARHLGYDRIPATLPSGDPLSDLATTPRPQEPVRDLMAHLGFHEAVGYAMIAEGEDEPFVWPGLEPAVRLTNPIAEPLSRLRRSVLPGLLRATDLNFRRGMRDVRLFELGHVFIPTVAEPQEPLHLAVAWSGCSQPRHWSGSNAEIDLFDLCGLGERVLEAVGAPAARRRRCGAPAAFHPGRSLQWSVDGASPIAWGGALHPRLQADLDHPLWLLEVDLGAAAASHVVPAQHAALPRFPTVSRDLALVVTAATTYDDLIAALQAVPAPAAVRFRAVDRYVGAPLADGESSLTIRLTLEPDDRTLTDEETEAFREALVDRLGKELGIQLRS